ncbi:aldehyde dehydrogenase [Turicibacter sp. TJ11]|uniref:aldehyde dehydrogenase n=1 Tax=Turicibacter sp. TJ11 TaxID=2806443 RepID=UPI001F3BAD3A|nr:aldehyde dehydrogenase [Turicibacter sp. TJ11]
MNLSEQLQGQKSYLQSVGPIPVSKRIEALKKLKQAIKQYETDLEVALKQDLGKSAFEAYTSEIGFVYASIDYTIKNLKKWARPRRVKSDFAQLVGSSYVYPSAYGVVLIIGPFNYPVQLLLEPLVGAIAGGNGAILKPSELTPTVEKVLVSLIKTAFDENYVSIVTGGVEVNQQLLDLPFDYIFFTGSVRVGKIVMEKASQHLIPVTLELGGKSPVIIDETSDLKLAAKRIAWGKFMNNGQTCVAPDYALVHHRVYDEFLSVLAETIRKFYGENPLLSEDYGRIVTTQHANRLAKLIDENKDKVTIGGDVDLAQRYIAPTIFKDVKADDTLMMEELFGPLLPTMSYESIEEIDAHLARHPKPLAFYVFSENKTFANELIHRYAFGGGCINDVVTHVASHYLPFGGVGPSGIGRYHGEASFTTFTYEKAIVKRSTKFPMSLVFPPYEDRLRWVKKFMK